MPPAVTSAWPHRDHTAAQGTRAAAERDQKIFRPIRAPSPEVGERQGARRTAAYPAAAKGIGVKQPTAPSPSVGPRRRDPAPRTHRKPSTPSSSAFPARPQRQLTNKPPSTACTAAYFRQPARGGRFFGYPWSSMGAVRSCSGCRRHRPETRVGRRSVHRSLTPRRTALARSTETWRCIRNQVGPLPVPSRRTGRTPSTAARGPAHPRIRRWWRSSTRARAVPVCAWPTLSR